MQRPISIIWFDRLFWASILTSFLTTAFAWNDMMAELEREAAGIRSATAVGITVAILAITLVILGALWFGITRRASNVAKWIYVVLTGLGTLSTIASLFDPNSLSGMWLLGTLLSTALSVASVICLFRADAVAWLTGKGPVDPGIFN